MFWIKVIIKLLINNFFWAGGWKGFQPAPLREIQLGQNNLDMKYLPL